MYKYFSTILLLVFSQACFAETKTYQTIAQPSEGAPSQKMSIPLISVDPDTGETRVFITSGSALNNGLARHDTQVYHARASYKAGSQSILASIVTLHQQMGATCPTGWIKQQEWTTLQTNNPELHYQFQCIHASPQD